MHTYADLLALVDEAPIILDQPAGHEAVDGQPVTSPGAEVIEADDDPHRLARVNLERYASHHAGRTLRFWRDEWYVWKGNRYQKITKDELRAKLSQSIKQEFDRLNLDRQKSATSDDGGPPTTQKVSMGLVSNVIQATSGMVVVSSHVEPGTWLPNKSRPAYISMKNGILDVNKLLDDRDDFLIDNTPQWFSMVSLPYGFDPAAECPRFDAFLEYNQEMDPERIKILQEWAGYCLLDDTGEQKFLVNEGEGSNGKSVYLAALTAMLGKDNVSNVQLEVFGDRFTRTDTLGKLLNAAGDCAEIDKAAEGYIKSFTSGDQMFFDRKGMPGINCRPTARLMVNCNNRPRFSDRSAGIWRRMLLIPWRVSITREKKVKNMDKVEWWQDSGELPGIFRWALVGLARLRAQGGFTESSVMVDALQDYQEEMNPTRVFLKENLEETTGGGVRASWLYSHYRRWIEENGHHPLAERSFGKEVKRCFPRVERKYRGGKSERFWFYEGIQFSQGEICGKETIDRTLF